MSTFKVCIFFCFPPVPTLVPVVHDLLGLCPLLALLLIFFSVWPERVLFKDSGFRLLLGPRFLRLVLLTTTTLRGKQCIFDQISVWYSTQTGAVSDECT